MGLSWYWNVPVFTVAIILIGGIQHRLAGLGHESSHYSFMKNRYLNDLIPDLFCMFPLMTTIHFYRLFHMGHHQFTNDPDRDPDLLNLGHGKRADEFPMPRWRFITVVYFVLLVAPIRFMRYQWAYFKVNTLGKGKNVYMERSPAGQPRDGNWPRLATVLGMLYIVALFAVLRFLTGIGSRSLARARWACRDRAARDRDLLLPDWAVFQSPFRQAYSARFASVLRMSYYTDLLVGLAHIRWATGGRSAIYPVLLWLVPLETSFMFFMFLRDVYQHSNADAGRLTNSRVFFTDPFTRWAVFVYGQDMHIPHHLFPAVPHYRLRRLHELLKARSCRLSRPGRRNARDLSRLVGSNHDSRRDEPTASQPGRDQPTNRMKHGNRLPVGIKRLSPDDPDDAGRLCGIAHPTILDSPPAPAEQQAGRQQARADDARDEARVESAERGQPETRAQDRDRGGRNGEKRDPNSAEERRDDQDQAADPRAERRDERQHFGGNHREVERLGRPRRDLRGRGRRRPGRATGSP